MLHSANRHSIVAREAVRSQAYCAAERELMGLISRAISSRTSMCPKELQSASSFSLPVRVADGPQASGSSG
eukprot:5323446-Pyramimonas_sp.AAC.1